MNIPIPAKGHDILPWATAVTRAIAPAFAPARGLLRSGSFGDAIEPLPENRRNRTGEASAPLPFAVRLVSTPAENDGEDPTLSASIYLPPDSLLFDGEYLAIGDAQPASADDEQPGDEAQHEHGHWRPVQGFSADTTALWLNVSLSDDDPPVPSASLTLDMEDEDAVLSVKIASFADRAVTQLVAGALAIGSPGAPDHASLERSDDRLLQIFDFDSADSDSARGLVQRLAADTGSGEISADGAGGISIVARRDGKLLYIPLSADGTDPDDRDGDDPDRDPCEHPGGGSGGVSPGDAFDGDGTPEGGRQESGGVPANGDTHVGDSNCNC